jgi:hypothetical protein
MRSSSAGKSGLRGSRVVKYVAVAGALATAAFVTLTGTAAAESVRPVRPAADTGMVPGTPCHIGTAACVRLGPKGYDGQAWFIRDHKVVRGPVPVATGGPGQDTSVGKFKVTIKDADHVSSETTDSEGNPSEMPYSVFFGGKGEAFHGGGKLTTRTAGCIRMRPGDDSFFYNNLQKGDQVEIVGMGATSASGGSSSSASEDDDWDDEDEDADEDDGDSKGLLGL